MQVYSPISNPKTHQFLYILPPDHWTCFIRVPCQLHCEHTVLQQFPSIKIIVHIGISVLPCTNLHMSQVKHLRVKCLAQKYIIETMSHYWEGRSRPHGRQRHWQSCTLWPLRHVPLSTYNAIYGISRWLILNTNRQPPNYLNVLFIY